MLAVKPLEAAINLFTQRPEILVAIVKVSPAVDFDKCVQYFWQID
jgi:hypothetical protein